MKGSGRALVGTVMVAVMESLSISCVYTKATAIDNRLRERVPSTDRINALLTGALSF